MASGKKLKEGGGVQCEILKNPVIDFYSGFSSGKKLKGGAFEIPTKYYSTVLYGGGGGGRGWNAIIYQILDPLKIQISDIRPPPPPNQLLDIMCSQKI